MPYIDLDSGTIVSGPIVFVPEIPESVTEGTDSDAREYGQENGRRLRVMPIEYDEDEILMYAENRANQTYEGDFPTEEDFATAEKEIREMIADGAWYDDDQGWMWA